MKRFALAIALACVLSGSALAGDGHTVGAPTPGDIQGPPVTSPGDVSSSGGFTSPGDMPTVGLSVLLTILDLAF